MSNKKILVLPGDGIGNEVMHEVLNIIDWLSKTRSMSFDISQRLVGGTAYDKEGDSISDETMQEALDSDAVLSVRLVVRNGIMLKRKTSRGGTTKIKERSRFIRKFKTGSCF